MKIHVYTPCYNEEILLPYFIRHYSTIAEKIYVYDNESTDKTAEICKRYKNVIHRVQSTAGKLCETNLLQIKNEEWKKESSNCDWVICCDVDEFLYHPNLIAYIESCRQCGLTIPNTTGYNMFCGEIPTCDCQLWEKYKRGYLYEKENKNVIFSPRDCEPNYGAGCHSCDPRGRNVQRGNITELKILHYRYLSMENTIARYKELSERLSDYNKQRGWGMEYYMAVENLINQHHVIDATAVEII